MSHTQHSNPKQSIEGDAAVADDLMKRTLPALHPERFKDGHEVNLPKFEMHWTTGSPALEEDPA